MNVSEVYQIYQKFISLSDLSYLFYDFKSYLSPASQRWRNSFWGTGYSAALKISFSTEIFSYCNYAFLCGDDSA